MSKNMHEFLSRPRVARISMHDERISEAVGEGWENPSLSSKARGILENTREQIGRESY